MSDFKVVAIVSAYNEADIIGPVLEHLIREGICVYLLDHASTDGTRDIAHAFLGRGVLHIEPFPLDASSAARDTFAWKDILDRKTQLSHQLDADWFIHHDADEFRESPWEGLRLVDAIQKVDRLGYDAIDFELFDFWPTDDRLRPGEDPRSVIRYYAPPRVFNKPQVKCWKKTHVIDLVTSGGHDVAFSGRQVFPLRFILRHYSIRSSAHAERKLYVERLPRLPADELTRGWHVQYGELSAMGRVLQPPEALTEYSDETARLKLIVRHRGVEELESRLETTSRLVEERSRSVAALLAKIDVVEERVATRDRTIADREQVIAVLREEGRALAATIERDQRLQEAQSVELRQRMNEMADLRVRFDEQHNLAARLLRDVEMQRQEIGALYGSKTWRWTEPLRAAYGLIRRRR